MRVLCRHGHFAFYPESENDVGTFNNIFDESLTRVNDFYTFSLLKDALKYSLKGKPYLGIPALVDFEGEPWEVMRENGFVYNIALKQLVPKESITIVIDPPIVGFFWLAATPLIQPGSRNFTGNPILSYDAQFAFKTQSLKVFEVQYV
jgi:hypothetical protein